MKTIFTILGLFICLLVSAQINYKTVVPQHPVITGESFQVQYIIEGVKKPIVVSPATFNGFRVVSGPNTYYGTKATDDGNIDIVNTVYTLEAIHPGQFTIPGTTAIVKEKKITSNTAKLNVLSVKQAAEKLKLAQATFRSASYLPPGIDPYKKIRENIFVKLLVDKNDCFVGEPVVATYKLYSSLDSKSDIIKNPGLYGFTVYDMVNLADKKAVEENINGKPFNVHTIRKVQLYPLQAGNFIIDEMVINNKVRFTKSTLNGKAEQEIAEGLQKHEIEEELVAGTEVYESEMATKPVSIHIKPLPEKNKPSTFSLAIGRFGISATIVNDTLFKNEQGSLQIMISGRGNFIQIEAPFVNWPTGVEAFETSVIDNIDKSEIPLAGNRLFQFPFTCSASGSYDIPATPFSFFDIDSNKYVTVYTPPIHFTVLNEEKKSVNNTVQKPSFEEGEKLIKRGMMVVLAIVAIILVHLVFRKKEEKIVLDNEPDEATATIEEILAPVYAATDAKEFYSLLHSALWQFSSQKYNLAGSEQHKIVLQEKMRGYGVNSTDCKNFFTILDECERGLYTPVEVEINKIAVLEKIKLLLQRM